DGGEGAEGVMRAVRVDRGRPAAVRAGHRGAFVAAFLTLLADPDRLCSLTQLAFRSLPSGMTDSGRSIEARPASDSGSLAPDSSADPAAAPRTVPSSADSATRISPSPRTAACR